MGIVVNTVNNIGIEGMPGVQKAPYSSYVQSALIESGARETLKNLHGGSKRCPIVNEMRNVLEGITYGDSTLSVLNAGFLAIYCLPQFGSSQIKTASIIHKPTFLPHLGVIGAVNGIKGAKPKIVTVAELPGLEDYSNKEGIWIGQQPPEGANPRNQFYLGGFGEKEILDAALRNTTWSDRVWGQYQEKKVNLPLQMKKKKVKNANLNQDVEFATKNLEQGFEAFANTVTKMGKGKRCINSILDWNEYNGTLKFGLMTQEGLLEIARKGGECVPFKTVPFEGEKHRFRVTHGQHDSEGQLHGVGVQMQWDQLNAFFNVWQGQFKHGKPHGICRWLKLSNQTPQDLRGPFYSYNGHWVEGVRHGWGEGITSDSTVEQGLWKNNRYRPVEEDEQWYIDWEYYNTKPVKQLWDFAPLPEEPEPSKM